ncbi:MAG TPA: peptidase M48, partial [Gammaproteobacteria bacterium]|nr:peptidase M48 [Gammaproteobacteria bacterium]
MLWRLIKMASFPSLALFFLTSCGHNPITGQKELHLVSKKQEISMGEDNYHYGQQQSGGIYR